MLEPVFAAAGGKLHGYWYGSSDADGYVLGELLERLRQRTHGAVTRPAGCTALLDADIPRPAGPEPTSSVAADRSPADLTARSGPAGACGLVLRTVPLGAQQ